MATSLKEIRERLIVQGNANVRDLALNIDNPLFLKMVIFYCRLYNK